MSGKDYCNCDHVWLFRGAVQSALNELTKPQPSCHQRAIEILSGVLRTDKALREAYEELAS